ncbi:MAG: Ligand-binding SRPBCC domain protein family [uncultured Sphingosinicella sp.]|uniref:Ligand-binding SRPBCC domain protein family n=1 Tax=uncultured Sphingosinicella sp. TaxID=478748 RepID=A0A6J4UBL0_9SPHN|nr:SRPBCC family protein [uncultured Sphingosinicella sp.]CAA9545766.1 MAG: Ligand-binding SRPBCC domain protein family [uncultured Sphingosinicella sp.]
MNTATAEHGVITEAGTIRFERLLPGPIERVWEYLVDPEKRRTWFADGAMDARPGGAFEYIWRNADLSEKGNDPVPEKYAKYAEHRMIGRIIEADPPHRLVHDWDASGTTPNEVTFELAERGDKVLLTLTHRRLSGRSGMLGVGAGWHTHLDILQAKLEGRDPPPFWRTHSRIEREYEDLIPAE